jgi:hypothetical protein
MLSNKIDNDPSTIRSSTIDPILSLQPDYCIRRTFLA